MTEKNCAWCGVDFQTEYSVQVYCSADCRDLAKREKIFQNYVLAKRKKRITKRRKCAGDCGTELSIYNDSNLCNACLINKKKYSAALREIRGFFGEET